METQVNMQPELLLGGPTGRVTPLWERCNATDGVGGHTGFSAFPGMTTPCTCSGRVARAGGAPAVTVRGLVHGLLVVCATALCAESEPGTPQLLAQGDSAWTRCDFEASMQLYARAVSADQGSYDAAWKLARACNGAGGVAARARDRRALFARAQIAAATAIRLNPDGAWAHFHRGLALGRAAMDTSIGERMRVAKEVRTEFERAVALDSTIVDGWNALGHWHRTMATLGWVERSFCDAFLGGVPKDASVSTAAACFERAVALEPQNIDLHLQLGITRQILGSSDAARREYQRVLDLPGTTAVDERKKAEARKRIAGLR